VRVSSVWLLAAVTFLSVLFCIADDARSQADALFLRAASQQNLRAPGAKAFHLRLRAHAEHIVAKPLDGTYDEVWIAQDMWRRRTSYPGFEQVEVGDKDSKWVLRNLDFSPRAVSLITTALEAFIHPDIMWSGAEISSVRSRKKNSIELTCASFGSYLDICADSSGRIVSVEANGVRYEYSDYTTYDGKTLPRVIRVGDNGKQVLRIDLEEISPPSDLANASFKHDSAAQQMAPCERSPESAITKAAPRYPSESRQNREEGTVTLYARINEKGLVDSTKVLQSPSDRLSASATEAVRRWTYAPMKCGAVPLPTEVEVRINYTLR
jgi:TonB family protein